MGPLIGILIVQMEHPRDPDAPDSINWDELFH